MKKILLASILAVVSFENLADEFLIYCGTYISKQHGIQKAVATLYGNTGEISYKAEGDTWYRAYNAQFDSASLTADGIRLWNNSDPRTHGKWEFQGKAMTKTTLLLKGCI
ncbi:hypothetical protein [Shewanella algae]|uniref:hypothetical protein n=1 Tax=Shewanella algae TaxID=38313 RepID=UPI0031F4D2AA